MSRKKVKQKGFLSFDFFKVGEPFAEQPYAVAVQQVTKQKLSLITSIQNPSLIPQFGSIECSSKNRGVIWMKKSPGWCLSSKKTDTLRHFMGGLQAIWTNKFHMLTWHTCTNNVQFVCWFKGKILVSVFQKKSSLTVLTAGTGTRRSGLSVQLSTTAMAALSALLAGSAYNHYESLY